MKEISAKVREFVEIAKLCPDNLQEKCFEVLLSKHLDQIQGKPVDDSAIGDQGGEDGAREVSQEDLSGSNLHVKAKRFLKNNKLAIEHINQIFYKEGDRILPLYDDLRSTKASECQIRIGLLIALKNAIQNGNFQFSGEVVREECGIRKCYDQNNFAANFKNNTELFEGFEKYKKQLPIIQLSSEGKAKLAELIKELQ